MSFVAVLIDGGEPSPFWNLYMAVFFLFCGVVLSGCAVVARSGPSLRRWLRIAEYDEVPLRAARFLAVLVGPAVIAFAVGVGWFVGDLGFAFFACLLEAIFVAIAYFFPSPDPDS